MAVVNLMRKLHLKQWLYIRQKRGSCPLKSFSSAGLNKLGLISQLLYHLTYISPRSFSPAKNGEITTFMILKPPNMPHGAYCGPVVVLKTLKKIIFRASDERAQPVPIYWQYIPFDTKRFIRASTRVQPELIYWQYWRYIYTLTKKDKIVLEKSANSKTG